MSDTMPWDELRDRGDDAELAELAELADFEAEEKERLAWIDGLDEGDPDLAVLVDRPGLAKAICRHGGYEFALVAETRHAVCCTCGHSWLIAVGEGNTDSLPGDLPGVALR